LEEGAVPLKMLAAAELKAMKARVKLPRLLAPIRQLRPITQQPISQAKQQRQ